MGARASAATTILSAGSLPEQLFVEGAGSARANGKFVLRTGKDVLPTKGVPACNRSAWFMKDNDEGCWMGFLDATKSGREDQLDERKWIIFTAKATLYMGPITDERITPRQGRWELGGSGAAPAPTVNLQPLPAAFRLSGWKGRNNLLNGEYVPLDDGSKLFNGRPVFKHDPVVGVLTHKDKWRMYWSHGAWRLGDEDNMKSDQTQSMAFVESDATHPIAMSAEVVWQVAASSQNDDSFDVAEGVSLATGTVRVECWNHSFPPPLVSPFNRILLLHK